MDRSDRRLPPCESVRGLLVFDGLASVFGADVALSAIALATAAYAAGLNESIQRGPFDGTRTTAIAKLRASWAVLRAERAVTEAIAEAEKRESLTSGR